MSIEDDQAAYGEQSKDPAAVALGRAGGKAGTGKAKVRTKAQIAKAVKARIAANKKRKAEAQANG